MALNYAKSNTFVTGTTTSSSAMNQNFDDLVNIFAGLEALTKSFTSLLIDTTLRTSGTFQAPDGTAANPTIVFTADSTTGFYRIGAGNVGLSCAGVKKFDVSATAANLQVNLAMNSNKVTGLANASSSGEAVSWGQLLTNNIVATATNDAGTAGNMGQQIESTVVSASAVSTTGNNNLFDVTSIALTAGDWDVHGIVIATLNAATTNSGSYFDAGVSVTSGNNSTGLVLGTNRLECGPPAAFDITLTLPAYRISLGSSTTVYLKCAMGFTGGTPKAYGRISARRPR